ncbi:RDD family protein [Flavobacterium piscisymbiosum]|uniref:RDD family protein n=1 Tax=Flavobacterium piscisymbiosum TaxID=2893753 RepID=A0ABS8M909_9FLAO|nr:RDD family protein [Flavobacterium sp. F-30]MCC9061924.1 RDD family protein [Flavobacterium sp. F-30]
MLFIGAIVFYISKEKETRILRFVFSVLLAGNCYFILLHFYFLFQPEQELALIQYFYSIVLIGLRIFMFYCFYKSIIYLNKLKVIDDKTLVRTWTTEVSYFKPDNWQRLFHFIFDSLIFGIIGFQFLFIFAHIKGFDSIFRSIEMLFSQQILLTIVVIFFGTLFYFVFESLFQATPSKFLTESRVVNKQGLKGSTLTIFKRSLSRNIPFDPLSFLAKANWHDSVSNTVVYKEKQTGVKGKYYLLLIPLSVIVVASMSYLEAKIKKDADLEYSNKVLKEKNAEILESLKTIDTNTILQLPTNVYSFKTFLKIENVSNASIEYSILYLQDEGEVAYVDKAYAKSKDRLRRGKIKRTDLQRMILTDFKHSPDYYENDKKTFLGISEIPALKGKYIEDVLELNSPNLKVLRQPNFTRNENMLILRLFNYGIPAELVSIKSEDKKVSWNMDGLPVEFDDYAPIYLRGEGKDFTHYKIQVLINDSLNKQFIYEISGTKDQNEAKVILMK